MFKNPNMSVVAYMNGFTMWHYKSQEDTIKDICEPGYFDKIKTLSAVGDIFLINAKDGTVIRVLTALSPKMEIGNLS